MLGSLTGLKRAVLNQVVRALVEEHGETLFRKLADLITDDDLDTPRWKFAATGWPTASTSPAQPRTIIIDLSGPTLYVCPYENAFGAGENWAKANLTNPF